MNELLVTTSDGNLFSHYTHLNIAKYAFDSFRVKIKNAGIDDDCVTYKYAILRDDGGNEIDRYNIGDKCDIVLVVKPDKQGLSQTEISRILWSLPKDAKIYPIKFYTKSGKYVIGFSTEDAGQLNPIIFKCIDDILCDPGLQSSGGIYGCAGATIQIIE